MKSTFSESLLIFVSPNDRHARWSLFCVFSCIFHAFAFALAYMSFFECFRNRLLSSFQCPFSELCVKLPQHSQAANSSPVGGTQGPCEFRGPENKPLQKPMCHVSWKIMSGCVSTRFFLNPSIHEIGMSCMESSPSTLQDKIRGSVSHCFQLRNPIHFEPVAHCKASSMRLGPEQRQNSSTMLASRMTVHPS